VVGHLVVGGNPVERAGVVIHTYSGRLGLTVTPKKSGREGKPKQKKTSEKKLEKLEWEEFGGKKKALDGRAHSCCCAERQRRGACGGLVVRLEVLVLLFCVFVLLAHRVGSLLFLC